jgi:hypothetical protein
MERHPGELDLQDGGPAGGAGQRHGAVDGGDPVGQPGQAGAGGRVRIASVLGLGLGIGAGVLLARVANDVGAGDLDLSVVGVPAVAVYAPAAGSFPTRRWPTCRSSSRPWR